MVTRVETNITAVILNDIYSIEARIASYAEIIFDEICELFEALKNLVYKAPKITELPKNQGYKTRTIAASAFNSVFVREILPKVTSFKAPENLKFNGSFSMEEVLEDGTSFKLDLVLPSGSSDAELERIQLHPLFTQQIENMVGSPHLADLLLSLPMQTSSLRWDGEKGEGFLVVNLPEGGKLQLEVALPGSNQLPPFLEGLLSAQLKGLYPTIQSILSENFTFIWDGKTSQFKLIFEKQEYITIQDIGLKGKGFIKKIAEKLVRGTVIKLPPQITGTIDFANSSIQFGEKTHFDISNVPKFDLDRLSYNPDTQELEFEVFLWGFIPFRQTIDLKQSRVDRVALEIQSREVAKQARKKEAVKRQSKPSLYAPLLKKIAHGLPLMVPQVKGNFTVDLHDGTRCKIGMELKGKEETVAKLKVHPLFTSKLEGTMSSDLAELLLSLPTQASEVRWDGQNREANIVINLPEGGLIQLELNFPKETKEFPKLIEAFLKHQLKDLYTPVIKPFLSESFYFMWDGSIPYFRMKFNDPQALRIKNLKLRSIDTPQQTNFLQRLKDYTKKITNAITEKFAKGKEIKLPTTIAAKVDFEDLSLTFLEPPFSEKVTFDIPLLPDVDLKKIKYDAKTNKIHIDIECMGRHKFEADLNQESSVNKFEFEILPLSNK